MKRSSAKPLQDPSTFDPSIPPNGADSIMDGEVWWVSFRRHEQTMFRHERDFSIVSLQKDHSVSQSLCHPGISLEHLLVCLLHRFLSLCTRRRCSCRRASSDEIFPERSGRCHPVHHCAGIAPSLLRPRRKPCQFGEKCSSPPSEIVSLTIAAKKTVPPRASDVVRVPSIPFCPLRLSSRVPFEQCALHGVWSARCACTRAETISCFARVYFCAVFVISSRPRPSSRRGPADKYDGDAQMRTSSAFALQFGAALHLFPLASSFAVLERIVVALFTMFMSSGSKRRHVRLKILVPLLRCRPPVRQFSHSLLAVSRGFSSLLCRDGNQEGERMPLPPCSCVSLCASWLLPCLSALCRSDSREVRRAAEDCLFHLRNCQFNDMSLCRACRCCSEW